MKPIQPQLELSDSDNATVLEDRRTAEDHRRCPICGFLPRQFRPCICTRCGLDLVHDSQAHYAPAGLNLRNNHKHYVVCHHCAEDRPGRIKRALQWSLEH